jgi:hypothetical protein
MGEWDSWGKDKELNVMVEILDGWMDRLIHGWIDAG